MTPTPPTDDRRGRVFAQRFVLEEWVGTSAFMGLGFGRDTFDGAPMRLLFGNPPALPYESLRGEAAPRTACSDVRYYGPVDADDGWAHGLAMWAETRSPLPTLRSLSNGAWAEARVRALVARLAALLAEPGLGVLRPESVYLDDARVELARGERLWWLARPLSVGALPPWGPGYLAPELYAAVPWKRPLAASADVFSLGVIGAERLLGVYPYAFDSFTELVSKQARGAHRALPGPVGAWLARCLAPDPAARPTIAELLVQA